MPAMSARSPNRATTSSTRSREESVIIARGNDGEIRALINSCRHRGSRVCEERQGHCKTFVCPYHGWVYGTDGSLRAARHMEAMPDSARKTTA